MLPRTMFAAAALIFGHAAMAQAPQAADANPVAFDVVSIKALRPDRNGLEFSFTADGFSAKGLSLTNLIHRAYFPLNTEGEDAVVGAPDWANKDRWDVEAKVAPKDMDAFQRHPFGRSPDSIGYLLLQSMLADRFHLVVHRVPAEIDGYALVVAKNGPKLKESVPDAPQPSGSLPMGSDGGYWVPVNRGLVLVQFYSTTMSDFATRLSANGVPVVDRTGLTGRYDFTWKGLPIDPDEKGADHMSNYDFGALGLKADHVKLPTEHIVIDHVERPSPN